MESYLDEEILYSHFESPCKRLLVNGKALSPDEWIEAANLAVEKFAAGGKLRFNSCVRIALLNRIYKNNTAAVINNGAELLLSVIYVSEAKLTVQMLQNLSHSRRNCRDTC